MSPARQQQGGFAPPGGGPRRDPPDAPRREGVRFDEPGATGPPGPVLGPPFGPPPSPPAGYGPPPPAAPQHERPSGGAPYGPYGTPQAQYGQPTAPPYGQQQSAHATPPGYLPPPGYPPPPEYPPYAPQQHGHPRPGPYGGPPYGGPYGPPAAQGWGAATGWYGAAQHPGSALLTAAAELRAAAVLLWTLQLAWLLLLGGGAALLSAGPRVDDVYGTSTALDTGDALTGLGALLYVGVGAAVWALAALWTSYVARACSVAGNGVLQKASWGWWGLFVPFAGLVLPLLAYREAAAYVVAAERVGGPGQGRGPWWRQERVPGLLPAWWALWAAAAVVMFVAVSTTDDPSTSGALFVVTGLLRMASSLCGAVVLRQLARSTAVCSSTSWG